MGEDRPVASEGGSRVRQLVPGAGYLLLILLVFSPALLTGRVLAPGDGAAQSYPCYHLGISLWTRYLFGGYPVLADPQSMNLYPVRVLLHAMGAPFSAFVVAAYVVASWGCHALVRRITGSHLAAATAGVAYGLSGFLMAHLGHTNMVHAAAWAPWVLHGIERLRGTGRGGVGTAIATCLMVLSGHPQTALYGVTLAGAYAAAVPPERDRRQHVVRALGALLLGVGLASVQLAPGWELAQWSARQKISFEAFSVPALLPSVLPSYAFPWLGAPAPIPTEMAGSVGLVVPLLALLAVLHATPRATVRFFAVVAVLGMVLALGAATPLCRLLYLLPPFHLFRGPVRHLWEMGLAASVLAGLGVAHLERTGAAASRALLRSGREVLAGAVLLAAVLWAAGKIMFPYAVRIVGLPLLLLLCGWGAALLVCRRPGRLAGAALLAALVADLGQVVWTSEWTYASPAEGALDPVPGMEEYRRELERSSERIIASVPAASAYAGNLLLHWRIPTAGGYNPLRLRRYADLLWLDEGGDLSPLALMESSFVLDLLAVRYILVDRDRTRGLDPFARSRLHSVAEGGMLWTSGEVETLLRAGGKGPRSAGIELPGFPVTDVGAVVTAEGCVPSCDGQVVGHLELATDGAGTLRVDLRGAPEGRHVEVHALGGRHHVGRLVASADGAAATLRVHKVTLHDRARQRSYPIPNLRDEPARLVPRGELPGLAVVENLRAFPRGWLVGAVARVSRFDAARAVRNSVLPDGSHFDPAALALVEEPVALSSGAVPGPAGTVRVQELHDTRASYAVEASRPAFLVTSDVFYPGWRAAVDGLPVPVHRVNYILRGVVVPAGAHTVTFVYRPWSLAWGGLGSTIAAAALAWLERRGPRR